MIKTSTNNIAKLRTARGWTQQELASRVPDKDGKIPGKSAISKLEKSQRGLTSDWLRRFAKAFNVDPNEIENMRSPVSTPGFSDNAVSWIPPEKHHLTPLLTDTTAFFQIQGNVLDEINILDGEVILIDMSPAAIDNMESGDVVVAQVYDDEKLTSASTVLRQFVFPALLITNSATGNLRPINMREADAHVKGVMVSSHRLATRR